MTEADRETLQRARLIVGALIGGVLILTALSGWMPRADGLVGLVVPAAVVGAASPVVAFRLYHLLRERITPTATDAVRRETYLRANVLAFAITEGAALFGVIVFALTDAPLALIGVAMHVLLAGALWPTEEKLAGFVGDAGRIDS
jgi:uncharacterized membrane protein